MSICFEKNGCMVYYDENGELKHVFQGILDAWKPKSERPKSWLKHSRIKHRIN